jgi:TPR repeat protein
VQSVFEFNNTAYMVMRFEKGMTLSALLDRRGTLPERELLRILLPILDGLELIHNAGFIHRDIKPDNIHIGDDGNPVLLDFGSARQALGSSHTLTILVAPGYAPFEQYYSDASSQGPWTDIYGLGATCYRAIAGRPPLDAVSRSKGILGSTQEILVPASVVGAGRYSGSLLAAIDHALAFAEKDRPQTIAAWRRELVAGHTLPPAATELHAAPTSTPPSASPARAVATANTIAAAPVTAPPAISEPATLPPTARVIQSRDDAAKRAKSPSVVIIVLAGLVLLGVGIAVYVAQQRNDETNAKISALEKQLQGRAEAEAKQKADQQKEDLERKAKEKAEQEKAQADARKSEEEKKRQEEQKRQDQVRIDEQKRRETAAPKSPDKDGSKANQAPAPSREAPPPQTAPLASQHPPAAEAPKSVPARTPAEQLADVNQAIAARRYDEAATILKSLADAGYAPAQARLGDMYAEGQGVTRDYKAAANWYEKAALQGDLSAEVKLAAMYSNGTGVERNANLAYVWYGIAARLGNAAAKTEQDKAASALQPAEREQADKLIEGKVRQMPKKP